MSMWSRYVYFIWWKYWNLDDISFENKCIDKADIRENSEVTWLKMYSWRQLCSYLVLLYGQRMLVQMAGVRGFYRGTVERWTSDRLKDYSLWGMKQKWRGDHPGKWRRNATCKLKKLRRCRVFVFGQQQAHRLEPVPWNSTSVIITSCELVGALQKAYSLPLCFFADVLQRDMFQTRSLIPKAASSLLND